MTGNEGFELGVAGTPYTSSQRSDPYNWRSTASNYQGFGWQWPGGPNTTSDDGQRRRTVIAALLGIPQHVLGGHLHQRTYSRAHQATWRCHRTRAVHEGKLQQHMQLLAHGHEGGGGERGSGMGGRVHQSHGQLSQVPAAPLFTEKADGNQTTCPSTVVNLGSDAEQPHSTGVFLPRPRGDVAAACMVHLSDRKSADGGIDSSPAFGVQENLSLVQEPHPVTPETVEMSYVWKRLSSAASKLVDCSVEKERWNLKMAMITGDAAVNCGRWQRQPQQPPQRLLFDFYAIEASCQDEVMYCLEELNVRAVANKLWMAPSSNGAATGKSGGPMVRDPRDTLLGYDLLDEGPSGLVNRTMLLLYVLESAAAYYDGDNESAKSLAEAQRRRAALLASGLLSYHGLPQWPWQELLELARLLAKLKELELSGNMPDVPIPECCTSLAMACRLIRGAGQVVEDYVLPAVTTGVERGLRTKEDGKPPAAHQKGENEGALPAAAVVGVGAGAGHDSHESQAAPGEEQTGAADGKAGVAAGAGLLPRLETAGTCAASAVGLQATRSTDGRNTITGGEVGNLTNTITGSSAVTWSNCSSNSSGTGGSVTNATNAAHPEDFLLNRDRRAIMRLQLELHSIGFASRRQHSTKALMMHLKVIASMRQRDWRTAAADAFPEEYKRRITAEFCQESQDGVARKKREKNGEEKSQAKHRQQQQQSRKQKQVETLVRRQLASTAASKPGPDVPGKGAGVHAAAVAADPDADKDSASPEHSNANCTVHVKTSDSLLPSLDRELAARLHDIVPWNSSSAPNDGLVRAPGGLLGPLESLPFVRRMEDGTLRPPLDPWAVRSDLARMLLSACLDGQRVAIKTLGDAALQLTLGATAAANGLLEPDLVGLEAVAGNMGHRRESDVKAATPVAVTLLGQPPQQPPQEQQQQQPSVGNREQVLTSNSSLLQLVPMTDDVIFRVRQAVRSVRTVAWYPAPPVSPATDACSPERVQVLREHLERALVHDSAVMIDCWGGRPTLVEATQAIAQAHWAALRQRREQLLVVPVLRELPQKRTIVEAARRIRDAYTQTTTITTSVVSTPSAATDTGAAAERRFGDTTAAIATTMSSEAAKAADRNCFPSSQSITRVVSVDPHWPILRRLHFNEELCHALALFPIHETLVVKGILHRGVGLRDEDKPNGQHSYAGGGVTQPSVLSEGALAFAATTRLALVVLSLGVSGAASVGAASGFKSGTGAATAAAAGMRS